MLITIFRDVCWARTSVIAIVRIAASFISVIVISCSQQDEAMFDPQRKLLKPWLIA
jgi:hypothetical protein